MFEYLDGWKSTEDYTAAWIGQLTVPSLTVTGRPGLEKKTLGSVPKASQVLIPKVSQVLVPKVFQLLVLKVSQVLVPKVLVPKVSQVLIPKVSQVLVPKASQVLVQFLPGLRSHRKNLHNVVFFNGTYTNIHKS